MCALFSLMAKQSASRALRVQHKMNMRTGMLNRHFMQGSKQFINPASCIVRSSSNMLSQQDKEMKLLNCGIGPNRSTNIPSALQLLPVLFSMESCGRLLACRSFHTTSYKLESKVEESLEAIKDSIKKDAVKGSDLRPSSFYSNSSKVKLVKDVVDAHPSQVVVKPPLTTRIMDELKHYYHGFRLLFIDVRVALRLIRAVVNGKTLMRRERKQLVRTTADLFRLVPFLVFILVPFAEFLLPVFLKFFPGMLPSTFQEANKELEKKRQKLKVKLEMAKFLQDTIEETALEKTHGKGENVQEFVNFMNRIRASGGQTSNEDILKFSKLFEDDITLDNLNHKQLRAMCQLLEITPVGPNYILRFRLEMKLRELEADDKMIQREGMDSMAVWEIQDACRQRGMRSFGVPEDRLKLQLSQWLDLHLNQKIPTSLLLLSRTLYFPEHYSTEEQLKATILALPDTLTDEAKVKISEVSGDRVDNKSKLEVIKQEEQLIMKERLEIDEATTMKDDLADLGKIPLTTDKTFAEPILADRDQIHSKDMEDLEDALDMVVEKKQKLKAEVEDLKNLKEEFSEYKENLDQLKEMLATDAPVASMDESKAAKRLSKKVEQMISKLDESVLDLSADSTSATEASDKTKTEKEMKAGDRVSDLHTKELLEKQSSLITIKELMSALEMMQKSTGTTKFEIIAKALDADQDGVIDYREALRFVELLGQENMKIDSEQMSKIMKILEKEKEVLEGEKLQKQQEHQQQQAYQVPGIPNHPHFTPEGSEGPVILEKASTPPLDEAISQQVHKKTGSIQPEKKL